MASGMYFFYVQDITIENCCLRRSKISALNLVQPEGNIVIVNTTFEFNVMRKSSNGDSGLGIFADDASKISVLISDSTFTGNGYFVNQCYGHGLYVRVATRAYLNFSLIISNTKFLSNCGGAVFQIFPYFLAPIILSELTVSDNTGKGIWFPSLTVPSVYSVGSNTTLTLSNSSFTNNKDGGFVCNAINENEGRTVNVVVEYCNFTNNSGYTSALALDIVGAIRNDFIVSIQYSNFVNNSNGAIDIILMKKDYHHTW